MDDDTPRSSTSSLSDVVLTTNTVDAALNLKNQNHQFNQLFNYVNHIDQIELQPGESQKVIIAFLPEDKESVDASSLDKHDNTFDFFEVNGMIFFVCFKLRRGEHHVPMEETVVASPKLGTRSDSKTVPHDGIQLAPDYQTTTKFRSRVCRSVLTTDISSTGLIFDDCVAGETYFKDFTIHNRSEIDLFWVLNTVDLSNKGDKAWLKFTDYETGEPLDFSPIPSYSPKRIRITFKPQEVGEFNYDLQIENQNDSSNTIQTHIHGVVRSELRNDKLVICSGANLDFGDCCAGMLKRKQLMLKNIGDTPLEIFFASDNAGEICFELRTEERPPVSVNLEKSRFRFDSRTVSDDSFRELDMSSQGEAQERYIHDRLNDPSGFSPRTYSDMSISRTRSSSGSIDSITHDQLDQSEVSFTRNFMEDSVRDRETSEENVQKIEELILRPGTEKTIDVCYTPSKEAITPDYRACKLTKRNFKLFMSYCNAGKSHLKEKSTVQCVSKVCTSAIEINPSEIHFGDTDVGTLKSASVDIKNCSELPAVVELRYVSKVLSSIRGELVIPAKQTLEVKIDIYPRKVNPDYRKEITVANLLNPDNDRIIQVHSTNIDKQKVTLHSLFYHVLTPHSTHYVDFGSSVLNNTVARSITLENVTESDVILELTTSLPNDLQLYIKADQLANILAVTRTSDRKEQLLQSMEGRRRKRDNSFKLGRQMSGSATNLPSSLSQSWLTESEEEQKDDLSHAYLDLASSNRSEPRSPGRKSQSQGAQLRSLRAQMNRRGTVGDESNTNGSFSRRNSLNQSSLESVDDAGSDKDVESTKMSLDELLCLAEKETGMPIPHFSSQGLEQKYVRMLQSIQKGLAEQIRDQYLIPVSTVCLAPKSSQTVYLLLNVSGEGHSYIQGKSKKLDCSIYFKMIDFDRELQHPQLDQLKQDPNWELPVRELMIRSFMCRSTMELGQKHINFGSLDKATRRTKRIVIRNKSEVALLYSVKKSGSIASGDLIFNEDRVGIVRGYGRREVEFIFDPSLPGVFQEKLTIQNVQDSENDQSLLVKSNIKQPANFHIQTQLLSFGPCMIDQVSPVVQTLTISNTSLRSSRLIEVRVDPLELRFEQCGCEVWFSVDTNEDPNEASARVLLSKETEEKIEQLEQKLKIATRKGRDDKVQKILEQLQMLRSGKKASEYDKGDDTSSPIGGDSKSPTNPNSKVSSTKDLFEKTTRVKATDSSIIIPIPRRGIKSVKVHIKPIRLQKIEKSLTENEIGTSIRSQLGNSDFESEVSSVSLNNLTIDTQKAELQSEICTARIYVHEQKNTDIVKRVLIKANVCYDQASYLKSLEEEKLNLALEDLQSETNIESPILSTPLENMPKTEAKFQNGMKVELSVIDLGRIELGDPKDCYFTLSNYLDVNVSYYVNLPSEYSSLVSKLAKYGSLKARESSRIELTVIPKRLGFGVVKIHIKSARIAEGCSTVTFVFFAVLPSYLQFSLVPSAPAKLVLSDAKQGTYDLDLGYCYIDTSKKFAKVIGLRVINTTKSSIYVSAHSNLALQCFLFSDESLESSWSSAPLKFAPLEQRTIYFALQPSASTQRKEKNSGTSMVQSTAMDCRSLIGGIRVSVYVKDTEPSISKLSSKSPVLNDGLVHAYTHTIKFNATIGCSILSLSTKLYDYGTLSAVGSTHKGFFTVSNVTQKMPLKFVVENSSSLLSLDKSEFYVGTAPDAGSGNNPDLYTEKVFFFLSCPEYGYYEEKFTIRNLNNSSQIYYVTIRAFIDPLVIDVGVLNGKTVSSNLELKWDHIYVTNRPGGEGVAYFIQQKANSDFTPLYESSFEVFNRNEELLHIVPISDVNVSLRWTINSSSGFCVDAQQSDRFPNYQVCGPVLLLQPKEKAICSIAVPNPTKLLQFHEDLTLGRKAPLTGTLLLQNASSHLAYKAIRLASSYCISLGTVEPTLFDFGKVGYISKWQDVKFEFTVQSSSEIPLQYDLDHPDFVTVTSIIDINTNLPVMKRIAEPGTIHRVELLFKPRKLSDALDGPQQFTIRYTNLYNPENVILMPCRYSLTQFELKFDRLSHGELLLPALTHPTKGNALPSDNWFSITNISTHDVKFELGCTLSPDVTSLVSLEILSRLTSAPVAGSINLAPKSSTELKIRAVAVEKGRLSDPNLLKGEGVTFGTFWLSTKTSSEDTNKTTETFPIRGTLVEGKTFSLSEKQLLFHTVDDSDTDEEEAKDPPSRPPSPEVQEKRLLVKNLANSFSIKIKVTLEYPIEFSADAHDLFEILTLDSDSCLVIEPNGVVELKLLLRQSSLYGESENFKLHFVDVDAIQPKIETVSIKFTDKASMTKMVASPTKEAKFLFDSPTVSDPVDVLPNAERVSEVSSRGLSVDTNDKVATMEVKGCKKSICSVTGEFQGLYLLELGQQDLSSTPFVKKLVLDLVSGTLANFKISTINSFDQGFLTFSRTEGTLDQTNPTNTVLLNFSLSNPGIWATYLILENLMNPLDTKYVRVMMEVVAKQNVKRVSMLEPASVTKVAYNQSNRIFDVYTNAMNPQNLQLDVGLVSYGVVYSDKSFVIHNWESVPMDFTISTSLPKEDQSEVMFSISRTGAKLFDTIRIEAESQKQVYIQFILEPNEGLTHEIKSFDIFINCRLIKDYQKGISFRAECQQPKLMVSETDFTFCTTLKSDTDIPQCRGKNEVIIMNCSNEAIEYQIISESTYFTMEHVIEKSVKQKMPSITSHFLHFLAKATGIDPSIYRTEDCNFPQWSLTKSFMLSKSDKMKLIPNMQAILRDKEILKRQKYILEHFVIYNKKNPQEKHRLNVKLNLGLLKEFQYASVSPNQFALLESQCFLILNTIACHTMMLVIFINKSEGDSFHDVYFLYRYIIDELVFFGTKEQAAQHHMNLATLLFRYLVLTRMIFSFDLKFHPRWVSPFLNFLSYFPKRTSRNSPVQELAAIASSDLF